jgi:iron complex transport system substrate-binding protein
MKRIRYFIFSGLCGWVLWTGLACTPTPPQPSSSTAVQSIVSLKPNITEILFELGLEKKIVGVTTYCTYPPAAKKIPKVASYIQANMEKIIALKPDLIITSQENSTKKEIVNLGELGMQVLTLPFYNLENIFNSILKIGVATGVANKAQKIVARIKNKLGGIQEKIKGQAKKKILVVFDLKPLVIAGGGSLFDEIITLLGAENIAHESKIRYPHYSTELMISRAPDIIIDISMSREMTQTERKAMALKWYHKYQSIPAVKNNQIYFLDVDEFHPSPRIIDGIQQVAQIIYPKIKL